MAVKEWKFDLDPPPPETRTHYREAGRPSLHVGVFQPSGETVVELQIDAEFGEQQRYAHLTPEEARKIAHALCDMADVVEAMLREDNHDEAA